MTGVVATRWKFLGGAALGAAVLALAPAAQAATTCERWDISGPWTVVQDNGAHADIVVTQGDTIILGNARAAAYQGGSLDGTLVGSDLKFTIYWNSGANTSEYYARNDIGDYVGTIAQTGRITGTTTKQGHPETHARWYSNKAMGCARWVTPAAAPAAGNAKTGKVLGRTYAPPGSAPARPMTICQRAIDAAERNSPTYEALKRECLSQH